MDVSQEHSMVFTGTSKYVARSDRGEIIDFSSKQGLYSVWLNGIPLTCDTRIIREAAERYGTLARFFAKPSTATDGVYFVKLHYLSKTSAVAAAAGLNDTMPWSTRPELGIDENTPAIRAKREHAVHEDFDYEEQVKQPNSLKKESLVAQLNTYLSPFGWSNSIDVIEVYSKCAKRSARDRPAEAPPLPHVEQLEALRKFILAEARSVAPIPAVPEGHLVSAGEQDPLPSLVAPSREEEAGLPAPPPTHVPAMTDEQIAAALARYNSSTPLRFAGPSGYGSLFEQMGLGTVHTAGKQAGKKRPRLAQQEEEEQDGLTDEPIEQPADVSVDNLNSSAMNAMLAELEEAHVMEEEARLQELDEKQLAADETLLARQRAIAEGIRRQMMVPDAQALCRVYRVRDTPLARASAVQHFAKPATQAEFPSHSNLKSAAVLTASSKDGHTSASVSTLPESLPVKAPCVFIRQMLHIHNGDGSTVTSVAAGGCGCRHGADGLDANVAFTSTPVEMNPVFATGSSSTVASRSGWRAGAAPFKLGTAAAVLAAEPPSEMAQQPALPMSQQLSQSPGDWLGGGRSVVHSVDSALMAGVSPPASQHEAGACLGGQGRKRRKKSVLRKAEFTAGKLVSGAPAKLVVDESLRFAANAIQIWIPTREAMHGFRAVING